MASHGVIMQNLPAHIAHFFSPPAPVLAPPAPQLECHSFEVRLHHLRVSQAVEAYDAALQRAVERAEEQASWVATSAGRENWSAGEALWGQSVIAATAIVAVAAAPVVLALSGAAMAVAALAVPAVLALCAVRA